MTFPLSLVAIVLFSTQSLTGQSTLSAPEILEKSIEYHDLDGVWATQPVAFRLFESRPGNTAEQGGNYRITDVTIDQRQGGFMLNQQRGPDLIMRKIAGDECSHTLNGHAVTNDTVVEAFGLTCTQTTRMRDYYSYLWGLPMKLKDAGTIIDDQVSRSDFFGTELLGVRVTYEGDVGSDTWYFYFDPETYALSGYRFYHDEEANDGEYILLEGEAAVAGMKIPASRKWYTHKEGRYLGEDRIIFNK